MNTLLSVCYDTSVWTEFGYTVQRYIGSATFAGIRIYAIIYGISIVAVLIHSITGMGK